ncbi:MAG: hypothetical protein H7145_12460 [Akkermansiaceae bacterium]|nr:hypothetical protein [Armatimonadota bacterium]
MAETNLAVRQLQKVARSLDAMEAMKDAETLFGPEQIRAWVRAAVTLCESASWREAEALRFSVMEAGNELGGSGPTNAVTLYDPRELKKKWPQ